MKIAIATCESLPELNPSERKNCILLNEQGLKVDIKVWDDEAVDWTAYDVVIVRTIWNYHLRYDQFLAWLALLEKQNVQVLNSVNILKENAHKFYLKRLKSLGVEIIPTIFVNKGILAQENEINNLNWSEAVIKPAVSASSYNTTLFDIGNLSKVLFVYKTELENRDYLIQKYMPEIQSHGELSIIFFNRKYSHTVLKTSKDNEFRVQSEYGGETQKYNPSKSTIEAASKVLTHFEGDLLYARIDGILVEDEFILMEAEMVEPELFFEHGTHSRSTFVQAVLDLLP